MINTGILRAGALGDLISLTPAIKHYALAHPEEKLTLICGDSYAHVLQNNPYISKIITFNDKAIYKGSTTAKIIETLKLAYAMRKLDKCFIMQEDSAWEFVADLAGIKTKCALPLEGNSYKRAMACMNIQGNTKPEYYPQSRCNFSLPKEYICIACGGGRNTKQRTPQKRWSGYPELIAKLSEEIVLIGDKEDSPNIIGENITDLCGKTSLDDAYHIIKGAKLFIGNDSGLLHLAQCTDTMSIGIFTATDPQVILPPDTKTQIAQSTLPCSPCVKKAKPRIDCDSECVNENFPDLILYFEKSGSLSNR